MRMRSSAWLLLPLALVALAGARQKPTQAQLKAEWTAFVKEYDAAYQAWLKPYRDAKTDEERSKAIDMAKMPAKDYVPKAIAFAKRAGKSEFAAQAWVWAYRNSEGQKPDKNKIEALDAMLKNYLGSALMVSIAQGLQYDGYVIGEKKAVDTLETLLAKSPNAEVKATALSSLAGINMPYSGGTPEQAKKARGYLDRLVKEFPNSKSAARAKGAIFELQNLQIGQTAPDIEATDENGKAFKLSDYRGKVVVLDFWGFW